MRLFPDRQSLAAEEEGVLRLVGGLSLRRSRSLSSMLLLLPLLGLWASASRRRPYPWLALPCDDVEELTACPWDVLRPVDWCVWLGAGLARVVGVYASSSSSNSSTSSFCTCVTAGPAREEEMNGTFRCVSVTTEAEGAGAGTCVARC